MSNFKDKKRKSQVHSDSPAQKVRRTLLPGSANSEKKIAKDVNIGHFAENRAIEIQALTEVVKDVGGNHLAFQKLPRHMRRRAMSHNIRRVPRRLHAHVKSELEKVKAPNKRPSRRFRRRPSNLLSEYERRKRRISWLETHIWHAKRFKMVEKWGHRLPLHPNEKSIRACYRAVQRHCLLQDVSFETYIEIKGKRESIIKGLEHLTSGETGLTFAARLNSRGTRQGSLVLYCYDCYPCQALGLVTYLWRPQVNTDEDATQESTLWLCCQPAFYSDVMKELMKCFPSSLAETYSDSDVKQETSSTDTESNVTITSLKDRLVKFRLFGPLSTLVLRETLKVWNFENCSVPNVNGKESGKEDEKLICESGEETKMWWKEFYRKEENFVINTQQRAAWEAVIACQSALEAPPHCVVSAVVRDPRLLLPPRRKKVFPGEEDSPVRKLPKELFNAAEVSASPLWEESVRHNVKVTKVLEKDLNKLKSKHLVPGTPLELGEKESRIPMLLIQRPGSCHLHSPSSSPLSASSLTQEGYSSGWDLLLPAGWAMAFWIALVYRGARVGGLREAHSISLQARQLNQVKDIPDSAAGKSEILSEEEAMQLKHDRRPPAKRPNYTKLGFPSPFSINFEQLCKDWMLKLPSLVNKHDKGLVLSDLPIGASHYVLRNKKMLQLLNFALFDMKSFLNSNLSENKDQSNKKQKRQEMNPLAKLLSVERGRAIISENRKALVPVSINILHRGVPASHAHICLPSREDLKMLSKDKHYGGPVESMHPDPEASTRKMERKERIRLRRKKKQGRKVSEKMPQPGGIGGDISQPDTGSAEVKKGMGDEESLDKNKSVVSSFVECASRPVIGFVTKGDYDLGQGQGSGMGFCSVAALLHIIVEQGRQKKCLVLVRNSTSTQYRFASLSIPYS